MSTLEESNIKIFDEGNETKVQTLSETIPKRVDPKDLDFELLEENVKHESAPTLKKKTYVKERCECKRRGFKCSDQKCFNRALRQECTASTCSLNKDVCLNRCLQKKSWRNVEIREAGAKGHGLYAGEDIEEDSFVLEYYGELIGTSEFKRRTKETGHRYFMALDEGLFLDPSRRGSIARFMNHSCDPNSVMEIWTVRGELRACVYTTKAINKNEELTFDYGWEPMAKKPLTKCRCGTSKCRNFIEDWEKFDFDASAHRVGTWEIPTGSPLVLHKTLSSYGVSPLVPTPSGADLVERRIRVWWDGNEDWFDADVIEYDHVKKLHLLQYCTDGEQGFEDLAGYVERGPLTDKDHHTSSTMKIKKPRDEHGTNTAHGTNNEEKEEEDVEEIEVPYYGLIYTNPEDLRYVDKESNQEVSCSIWELLNEGTSQIEENDIPLPVAPKKKREKVMKKKSSASSPTSKDTLSTTTTSTTMNNGSVIQRKNNLQRIRNGTGIRRSDVVNSTIPFPPKVPYPQNTISSISSSPWHNTYQQTSYIPTNNIQSFHVGTTNMNSYDHSSKRYSFHSNNGNDMKEIELKHKVENALLIADFDFGDKKSFTIELGNLDKRKKLFVGTFKIHNRGKQSIVYKVKMNENAYETAVQECNFLKTAYEKKTITQKDNETKDDEEGQYKPIHYNKKSEVDDNETYTPIHRKASSSSSSSSSSSTTIKPTLPTTAPRLAPNYGMIGPNSSVEIRVNIFEEEIQQLREYSLHYLKLNQSLHKQHVKELSRAEEYIPKVLKKKNLWKFDMPCIVDAIACKDDDDNDKDSVVKLSELIQGGPKAAEKLFYELKQHLIQDEASKGGRGREEVEKIKQISSKLISCIAIIDTQAVIENEKINEKLLNTNSSSSNMKRSSSSSSSSSSSNKKSKHGDKLGIKNCGDLSTDELQCGWRMKLSSSRDGKPYYFHEKNKSDVVWSRKVMREHVAKWKSEKRESAEKSQSSETLLVPPPPPDTPESKKRRSS